MQLPALKHDYSHSAISDAVFGPRHEVTLSIRVLEWTGQSGQLSYLGSLRFGGVINLKEVKEFFSQHQTLE